MRELEAALESLLAMRPGCPALVNLALDCWRVGADRGEAEGLAWAANVRAGVERYEAYQRMLASYGSWAKEVTHGDLKRTGD